MKVSFIVPVYNTDILKLKRCFMSIIKCQNINIDYECLIIDDGSNESTASFCCEFAENTDCFRYIHKQNGGVSSARNLGIHEATGDYISFVDSDDEIIAENISFLEKDLSADIYFTDLCLVDRGKQYIWKAFEKKKNGSVTPEDVLKHMVSNGTLNGPVCKFIRRDFLKDNNILFSEDLIVGEDAVFLLSLIRKCPRMFYYSVKSYYYYKEGETGNNRLLSRTETVVLNNTQMFRIMIDTISNMTASAVTKNHLKSQAVERYVKQIFNVASGLIQYHMFNAEMKELIYRAYDDVKCYFKDSIKWKISRRALFQYKIVADRKWCVLSVYSFSRSVYLKIKGVH